MGPRIQFLGYPIHTQFHRPDAISAPRLVDGDATTHISFRPCLPGRRRIEWVYDEDAPRRGVREQVSDQPKTQPATQPTPPIPRGVPESERVGPQADPSLPF